MGLRDMLMGKADAAREGSAHAIALYERGEIDKDQAVDAAQRYLEADRAVLAYDADNPTVPSVQCSPAPEMQSNPWSGYFDADGYWIN